jgi:amphi-Trp domain-containing protein
MSKKRISLKGSTDLAQAIEYLEDIVSSLKNGTLCVQNGSDEALTLKPEKTLHLEIDASQRADKESVTIELSWRKAEAKQEALPLKISSQEPVSKSAE